MSHAVKIVLLILNGTLAVLLWGRETIATTPGEVASGTGILAEQQLDDTNFGETSQSVPAATEPSEREKETKWIEFARFLEDPECRRAAKAHLMGRAAKNYRELALALGLDGANAARLSDLVAEKELAVVETYLEKRAGSPEEVSAALRGTIDRYDERIATELGQEGYAAYRGYVDVLALRRGVEKFEDYIRFSGEPLNAAQKEALIGGIGRLKKEAGDTNGGYPLLGQNWEDPRENSLETARSILSEGQLARYLDYLKRNGSARSAMEKQREKIARMAAER